MILLNIAANYHTNTPILNILTIKYLTMTPLEIYKKHLTRLNYCSTTINQYSWFVSKYLSDTRISPSQLTFKVLDEYLLMHNWTSTSQQNQCINALKLFYKFVLGKKDVHLSKIERPRKEKKLPKVLDVAFVLGKLELIENIKHKSILTLCFSVGLRRSEIINMKINDIDSERMRIRIRQGKGRKDREAPLTQKVLELLRVYFIKYKPVEYLFNGQNSKPQYSPTSCDKIFKKYISKNHSMHTLRHSCFTDLASKKVNIKFIQDLAGHSSSKTTERYLQTSSHLNALPLAI